MTWIVFGCVAFWVWCVWCGVCGVGVGRCRVWVCVFAIVMSSRCFLEGSVSDRKSVV